MSQLNMFELPSKSTCYIGDSWHAFSNLARIEVSNPANGDLIGEVPNCGANETNFAIKAATEAFKIWSNNSPAERSTILKRIAALINEHSHPLAALITREQGKPRKEALGEIAYGAAYFEWFSEEVKRIYGDVVPALNGSNRILVLKQPIGVCAAITPWNFPHAMLARKLAAALAAGCTFISKPAPETPLSALALARICELAGLPGGVFNVVTGDAEPIAEALMKSPEVRKISFTGSTEVGKILIRSSAETVKRLTMELGGNAPFIVFEDGDVERAIRDSIFAKFRNAGQTCICVNRFIVHKNIEAKFLSGLSAAVKKLKIGDGSENDTDIGPLISEEACQKVTRLMDDAIAKGANNVLKGGRMSGLFISPAILSGVTEAMSLWNEEIFGPIAAIATFETEEEALALANNTESGLAAYFYTQDLSRAFRFSERLQYGMVGVNTSTLSAVEAPFGGIKQSGYGREGSRHGIDDYLNLKYVALGSGMAG